MTSREFYIERRKAELPVFLNVIRALPADRLDYKPHERCPPAEQLVWTITNELRFCLGAAKDRRAEWKLEPAPPIEEMLQLFERWSHDLITHVESMDDAAWNAPMQFFVSGHMVKEQPVSDFLWFFLFDGIHHRGQLSAYIRPMGGKVPSIYGPSADSRIAV